MAYYTDFKLQVFPGASEELLKESLYQESFTVEDLINADIDSCKWYENDADMENLSMRYPDFLFILDGKGERPADIWRSFYKNGESYTWKLEYELPEFDESKLE